ncbi:MAG: hypothetical protein NTY45_07240 [Elusimicrobia bacterium]|nr:hypothetical protein [Elusimicrobiota bacterium]
MRALFHLLLRTAVWAALILASGLYCVKEGALNGFKWNRPVTTAPQAENLPVEKPVVLPAPDRAAPAAAGTARTAPADPLALIKQDEPPPRRASPDRKPAARGGPAAIPRMRPVTFGGSGGNFARLTADEPAGSGAAAHPPAAGGRARAEDGVVLTPGALSKKIRVKGAAPVSPAAEKRYTGEDPEAEKLRAAVRAKAEAAAAARRQLRREQFMAAGLLLLAALAIILIPSRLIKAWRLLERPEGKHWTLK